MTIKCRARKLLYGGPWPFDEEGQKDPGHNLFNPKKSPICVFTYSVHHLTTTHSPLITEENKFKTSLRGSCKAKFNSQFYRDDNQKQTNKKKKKV